MPLVLYMPKESIETLSLPAAAVLTAQQKLFDLNHFSLITFRFSLVTLDKY